MNKFLSGIVSVLGVFALFVVVQGWPVEIQERVKTETLTIEWHYPPSCPDFDDIITKPMKEKDIWANIELYEAGRG